MREKKKEFLRASPMTQYSWASDSIAQIEGHPIKCASHENFIPIAAEIAIRVPAYDPGPSPTIIVAGAPNVLFTVCRFSKNFAEFLRSFLQSSANWISPSNHARLPRRLESSSARVFIAAIKNRYQPLTFRFYLKGNPVRILGKQIREAIGPFDYGNSAAKKIILQSKSRD